jgi:hypothetical protein
MQLLKKASIKLFISIVGISIALPLPSIAMPHTGGSFFRIAKAFAAPSNVETVELADLLAGKTYGNIVAPEDYSFESSAGNVNLVKGMPIADGIPLGAVAAFKDLTPSSALKAAGVTLDLNAVQAGDLEFLKETSIKDLVLADPTLKSIKAEAIGWVEQGSKTLGDIAKTNLGDKFLPEAVLKSTSIGQLGDIANVAYGKYPKAANLSIKKFMGLADIPIAKNLTAALSQSLPPGVHLIKIDKVRTQEKGAGVNPKIVTGSDQRPKAQWTSSAPVNVVEIRDSVIGDKTNLVNGALMVDGSSQMIPGGNVPSPLQPAALAIPGTNLALSVHSLNAKNGSARVQLNMRLEYMFGLKTSYFIPIPVPFTMTEKSKTTLLFPLEIQQPSSTVVSNILPAPSNTLAPETPSTQASDAPKTETSAPETASAIDPVAANIANGNIGVAVKTNAFNPATGA